MDAYQINDLEKLTGIKAHTIRIWEKRYNLISPSRTDTNRRFYTDEQVRKLLNVTTLLSYGYKISKIASLSDNQIFEEIESNTHGSLSTHVYTTYINDLVSTMLAYDEAGFEKIFSAAVLRMGLYDTMMKVIYPFLMKIGVLWSINKAAPVQEHFASCIIRRKLMAVVDALVPQAKHAGRFLLFLPPDEWHDIGLLFANYLIRFSGYDTIFLGQNVPKENMEKIVEATAPDALLTLFTTTRPTAEINKLIRFYGDLTPMPVYISGPLEMQEHMMRIAPNIHVMKDVPALTAMLKKVKNV